MSDEVEYCKKQVTQPGMAFARYSRCSRKAKRDGYCTQHHPDAKAARDKARDEKWERDRENSPYRVIQRLKARVLELEEAARVVLDDVYIAAAIDEWATSEKAANALDKLLGGE